MQHCGSGVTASKTSWLSGGLPAVGSQEVLLGGPLAGVQGPLLRALRGGHVGPRGDRGLRRGVVPGFPGDAGQPRGLCHAAETSGGR